MRIPHEPGLTAGPHQKRKAVFDAAVWLINIPAQLLRDDSHLEATLSGLAVDIATEMARLMEVNRTTRSSDGPFNSVTMFQDRFRKALEETGAQTTSETFIESHPESIASVLRSFSKFLQNDTINHFWHEAERPDLKAKAKASKASGEADANNTSLAAYRTGAWKEWNHPLVALRRAVVGAGWKQQVEQQFSMLSPEAKKLVQLASVTNDSDGFMGAVDILFRQQKFPKKLLS